MTAELLVDIDFQPDIVVELPARIESLDGRPSIVPLDPSRWNAGLLKLVDKPVRVALIRDRNRRTPPQNRFYWGPFLGEFLTALHQKAVDKGVPPTFRTKERLHEAMKYRFLGVEVLELPNGKEIEVPSTTTLLTTVQFNAYWRSIARWAAEDLTVYLPEPNEVWAA